MIRLGTAAAVIFSALTGTAAELVINGDFETGNFTGWTKSGNPSLSDVIANTVTSNHSFVWRSGATGSKAFISQLLVTTPGESYDLSFDVYNTATDNSFFEADFNLFTVLMFENEVHNWSHFSFTGLVATGTSTELKFGAQNNPSFTRLDNISVTPSVSVPESTATASLALGALFVMAWAGKRVSR